MKNILFYSPYTVYPFHFETDLELIYEFIQSGHKVTFLTCDSELLSCEPNPFHIDERCQSCIQRRLNGFEILKLNNKVKFESWRFLNNENKEIVDRYKDISVNSIEELNSIYFETYDLGRSILSLLIDITRDPNPNVFRWRDFIKRSIISSLETYLSIKNHLASQKYSSFYLFKGRSVCLQAALRAAQSLSIELVVHERADAFNKYRLTYGTYPHDLNFHRAKIIEHWDDSQELKESKQIKAQKWFNDRREGKAQGWFSFTNRQSHKLPPNFNSKKTNIAIFNSSEYEMATIENWQNKIYSDQNEGLLKIIADFKLHPDMDFYIRVHPNLKGVNSSQTRLISSLKNKYRNVHIIDAHQKYSSYLLLDACDLIITFGSTIGIEAAYWKKPSLLLGRAMYEDLEACLTVVSHEEVVSVLKEKRFDLDQNTLEANHFNSLKYGYYMETYGIPFKIFQQDQVTKLNLNGIRITDDQPKISKIIWKLKYFYKRHLIIF